MIPGLVGYVSGGGKSGHDRVQEEGIFIGEDGAEIEPEGAIFDAGDDPGVARSQAGGQFMRGEGRMVEDDGMAGNGVGGDGSPAEVGVGFSDVYGQILAGLLQLIGEVVASPGDGFEGGGKQPVDGDGAGGGLGVAVKLKGGSEGGEEDFVHAEGPHEGVLFKPVNQGFFAHDDARLGTAKEFIAAEEDEVGPGGEGVVGVGFVGIPAPASGGLKSPGADIVDDGKVVLVA